MNELLPSLISNKNADFFFKTRRGASLNFFGNITWLIYRDTFPMIYHQTDDNRIHQMRQLGVYQSWKNAVQKYANNNVPNYWSLSTSYSFDLLLLQHCL